MHAHTRLHTACSYMARETESSRHVPARMCTHTHVMMSRYAVCMHDWFTIGSHAHMQHTVRIGFGVEIQLACIYTRSSQQGAYTHVNTYRHTHHNMRSPMRIRTPHAPGGATCTRTHTHSVRFHDRFVHTHITHMMFG